LANARAAEFQRKVDAYFIP